MPICRPLGEGLWELRSSLPSHREARVFFGHHEGMLLMLHAVIKTQKAAPTDLALARRRLKEMSP